MRHQRIWDAMPTYIKGRSVSKSAPLFVLSFADPEGHSPLWSSIPKSCPLAFPCLFFVQVPFPGELSSTLLRRRVLLLPPAGASVPHLLQMRTSHNSASPLLNNLASENLFLPQSVSEKFDRLDIKKDQPFLSKFEAFGSQQDQPPQSHLAAGFKYQHWL